MRAHQLLLRPTIFALFVGLVACSGTENDFEIAASPDGRFDLIVTVTEPGLPHARHLIKVYIAPSGSLERELLLETKLANDGVPFTAQNIGVRWTGATAALVCLRPTDLADRGIRVSVNGPPTAEIKPGC